MKVKKRILIRVGNNFIKKKSNNGVKILNEVSRKKGRNLSDIKRKY